MLMDDDDSRSASAREIRAKAPPAVAKDREARSTAAMQRAPLVAAITPTLHDIATHTATARRLGMASPGRSRLMAIAACKAHGEPAPPERYRGAAPVAIRQPLCRR